MSPSLAPLRRLPLAALAFRAALAALAVLAVTALFAPPAGARDDAYLEGVREYRNGRPDRSEEAFRRALVDDPENVMALFWMARLSVERRLWREAKGFITMARLLKVDPRKMVPALPDDASLLEKRGQLVVREIAKGRVAFKTAQDLLWAGKWSEAEAKMADAIAADPGEPRYLRALGDLLADRGRPDEAVENYKKAVLLAPRDPILRGKLSRALAKVGTNERALEELEAAYRLDGDRKRLSEIRRLSETVRSGPRAHAVVIKRDGSTLFFDRGFETGLRMGEEFRRRYRVTRPPRDADLRDPETGALLDREPEVGVGEVVLVAIGDRSSEGRVVSERAGGIRAGDHVWPLSSEPEPARGGPDGS